jgi:hypothetical protein
MANSLATVIRGFSGREIPWAFKGISKIQIWRKCFSLEQWAKT